MTCKVVDTYIYQYLLGKTKCMHSICQKWEHQLHYTPESSKIQKIHIIIFRFTPDIGLRYFQYKVVNKILFLNKQLYMYKMKIVDEKCSFCKRELKDIVHFFL